MARLRPASGTAPWQASVASHFLITHLALYITGRRGRRPSRYLPHICLFMGGAPASVPYALNHNLGGKGAWGPSSSRKRNFRLRQGYGATRRRGKQGGPCFSSGKWQMANGKCCFALSHLQLINQEAEVRGAGRSLFFQAKPVLRSRRKHSGASLHAPCRPDLTRLSHGSAGASPSHASLRTHCTFGRGNRVNRLNRTSRLRGYRFAFRVQHSVARIMPMPIWCSAFPGF